MKTHIVNKITKRVMEIRNLYKLEGSKLSLETWAWKRLDLLTKYNPDQHITIMALNYILIGEQ